MRSFLANYKLSIPVLGAALIGLLWVAFGFFGLHTLFIDKTVDEAEPTFDLSPSATVAADSAVEIGDPVDETPVDETPAETPVDDSAVDDAPAVAAPAVVTEFVGEFTSDEHPTSGRAVVLGNGTGQRFLRFEDFETDNGPDLNVWLVNSSAGVDDRYDLGDLKGNIGEQNYELPPDVDLEAYDQVFIWCVRFGVSFGNAVISAA